MRLLADENVPSGVVSALRERGHEVAWCRDSSPGAPDGEVLARAVLEERVLVTFDKDFGVLVHRLGQAASCGVVLFRLGTERPAEVAARVVAVLGSRSDWVGQFSVVESDRLRMRPLR